MPINEQSNASKNIVTAAQRNALPMIVSFSRTRAAAHKRCAKCHQLAKDFVLEGWRPFYKFIAPIGKKHAHYVRTLGLDGDSHLRVSARQAISPLLNRPGAYYNFLS